MHRGREAKTVFTWSKIKKCSHYLEGSLTKPKGGKWVSQYKQEVIHAGGQADKRNTRLERKRNDAAYRR